MSVFKSPAWASLIDVNMADGVVQALSLARLAAYGLPIPLSAAQEASPYIQAPASALGLALAHALRTKQDEAVNGVEGSTETSQRSFGDPGIGAVARHARNITLCEAMYPVLHMLEVVMRNSIHDAFCGHFGARDWYDQEWLNDNHRRFVADAKNELSKRSKPHEPDRVIAELSFGFWCGMFHSNYEHGPRAAWPALLSVVMPKVPKSWRTRFKVQGRVEDARALRNRVFHHESIAHLPDLCERHRYLIELLGWFSPEARRHIEHVCRFRRAYDDALVRFDQASI